MSHYDNPFLVSYNFGSIVFTAATSWALKPPPGVSRGKIIDIQVQASVVFNAVTTPAYVRIGKAGTAAFYGELNLGTTAANAATGIRDMASYAAAVFRDIDLVQDGVTDVKVTTVANTGGSPTGTGVLNIAIAWW